MERKEIARKVYKNSELRFHNIISSLYAKGFRSFDTNEIRGKMKFGLEDDEIIQDIINEILLGEGDHDLVEIDFEKQYIKYLKDLLKQYPDSYDFDAKVEWIVDNWKSFEKLLMISSNIIRNSGEIIRDFKIRIWEFQEQLNQIAKTIRFTSNG